MSKVEQLPAGWRNADIQTKKKQTTQIIGFGPYRKAMCFGQEPVTDIALKSLALFVVGWNLYMSIYTAIQLIRLPVCPIVNRSPRMVFKELWNVVRIPFYWIAMEFAAFYGIFRPLDGRAWFAYLESALHGGKERHAALILSGKQDEWVEWFIEAITIPEQKRAFFAAFCFQPFGEADSPNIKVKYLSA